MKKSLLVLWVTGAMGALLAVAADQPVPGGGGPGGGPGGPGNFQGFGRGGMFGLDNEQRQLYQDALQKDGDKLRALEDKLRVAQKDLLQATLDVKFDEKAVQSKAQAVVKIQVEMTMLRTAALASAAPAMKAEQKQQLIESPFGIMMLSSGGWGGWGGFGGGGQRGGFPAGGPGGFAPGGLGGGPGDAVPGGGRSPEPR